LDTIQAAILNAKFNIFPEEIEKRQWVANKYSQIISQSVSRLKTPLVPNFSKSAWAQYSLLALDSHHRSVTQKMLLKAGIPTARYYPKPLHLQEAFTALGYHKGDFLISEDYANRIFSLPMHPYLKQSEQEKIVKAMTKINS